jgi:hypothetical protein
MATEIKRLDLQFPLNPRDPIRRELRKLLAVLEARLSAFDKLQKSYDDIVEEARLMGLQRINETLTPVVQDALDRLYRVQRLFEAASDTAYTVGTGHFLWYVLQEDRALFIPLDFVVVSRTSDPENIYVYGKVISYDRASGAIEVDVLAAHGAGGPYNDWTIRAAAPSDVDHANRTDNPHQTTAAQVGAYTIVQTDAAIAAAVANAINALVDAAPGALDTLNELAAALGDDAAFATTVTNGLANRLRFDAAQTLSSPQKSQAQDNLGAGAFGKSIIAVPDMETAMRLIGHPGPKNLVINSGFVVAQEYGNASQAGASGNYPCDMFRVYNATNAAFTHQRTAEVQGHTQRAPYGVHLAITSPDPSIAAAQWFGFGTAIEGQDFAQQKFGIGETYGRPILVSILLIPPMAGTFYVALINGAANRRYIHPVVITAPEVGQFKYIRFIVPPDNTGTWDWGTGIGLMVRFVVAAGSNFHTATLDQWQANASLLAGADISNGVGAGVTWKFYQFEVYDATGLIAGQYPEYVPPLVSAEMNKCRRYHQYVYDTIYYSNGVAGATVGRHFALPAVMRVNPTASITWHVHNVSAWNYVGSVWNGQYSANSGTATQLYLGVLPAELDARMG